MSKTPIEPTLKSLLVKIIPCLVLVLIVSSIPATQGVPSQVLTLERVRAIRLRVMTYNIHVGFGMDKKLDLRRISEVILSDRPDLVALQEVDRGVRRTNGIDEIVELARLTRMNYAFAPNLDYQGGKYGVAVLSRYPILAIDHRRYANRREAERRGFIRVEVLVKGLKVHFASTHLDYQLADGRLFETEQLLKSLESVEGPLIVAGDFNDEPKGMSYQLMLSNFTDAWIDALSGSGGDGFTFPADKPVKRIDYVFIAKSRGVSAKGAVVRPTQASDHLPLVIDLELALR